MLLEKLSRQLEQFLQEEDADYFESQKPYALAVSTGVDSMALLKVMKHLFDRLNRSFLLFILTIVYGKNLKKNKRI